jgi:hypothetical protein
LYIFSCFCVVWRHLKQRDMIYFCNFSQGMCKSNYSFLWDNVLFALLNPNWLIVFSRTSSWDNLQSFISKGPPIPKLTWFIWSCLSQNWTNTIDMYRMWYANCGYQIDTQRSTIIVLQYMWNRHSNNFLITHRRIESRNTAKIQTFYYFML